MKKDSYQNAFNKANLSLIFQSVSIANFRRKWLANKDINNKNTSDFFIYIGLHALIISSVCLIYFNLEKNANKILEEKIKRECANNEKFIKKYQEYESFIYDKAFGKGAYDKNLKDGKYDKIFGMYKQNEFSINLKNLNGLSF
jgi:hypothetical protein